MTMPSLTVMRLGAYDSALGVEVTARGVPRLISHSDLFVWAEGHALHLSPALPSLTG